MINKSVLFVLYVLFLSNLVYSQCPAHANFKFRRLCSQNRIDFTDSSYIVGTGDIVSWVWDFGDGSPQYNGKNPPVHNYPSTGCYNVKLVVTDSSGCKDSIIKLVCVDPLPVANFSFPNNQCSGSSVQFTFTGTGVGLTYNWDFGDGNTSTLQNPSHVFRSYGCGNAVFNVRLRIRDRNGCTDQITIPVTIRQQPNVSYWEEHNFLFCHSDSNNLSDTARIYNFSPSYGCITHYTVNWGDGSPSQTFTPAQFSSFIPIEHRYTRLGYYTIAITAYGSNGCQITTYDTVILETAPIATVVAPPIGNIGCAPLTFCVTNNSSNISRTTLMTINWGDGIIDTLPFTSVGQQVCHTYTQTGCNNGVMNSYTITLTAQNVCDFTQNTFSPIRVYQPPQARFNIADDSICLGQRATFINISLPNSCANPSTTRYFWDFGDGTTFGPHSVPWFLNPQQVVNHMYTDTGTYVVTLTACNNAGGLQPGCGCTQFQRRIFVSQTFAEFRYDTVCFGDTTHFFDQSWAPGGHIIAWTWNFGDGFTSTQQNPTHVYNNWGDYNAYLIARSNLGCEDTVWHIVHVDTLPYVNFTAPTVCFGDSTPFTNLSRGRGANIVYYEWWFGDGDTAYNVVNPVHYYDAPGTYVVTLIAIDDKGCKDTTSRSVIVSPLPIANFRSDTVCEGSPTNFTNLSTAPFGTITSYQWNFGDGIGTSNLPNPSYTYPDSGTYNVQLIVQTNIGCRDTIVKTAYVAPYPQADFTFDTACFGYPTHFTSTPQGFGWPIPSYQWNFGDGNSSSAPNPSHLYANPGTYNVRLIISNPFGCRDTIIHTVTVYRPPIAEFSYDTACLHDSTHFLNQSLPTDNPIASYLWNFGDGNNSTFTNPTHLYNTSGSYTVTLYVSDSYGCRDTISHTVPVSPPPIANFRSDT
ncbi:MAG: PKD domain-containing protein, partial [Bacteroidales bacterium]|nr:PKD domain-containing protein [Bacteroidales bacterium]